MSPRDKVFIIYNPSAGLAIKGVALPIIKAYMKKYKIEYKILIMEGETILREQIKEMVILGFNKFLAAGGDGTVSLVADALYGSNLPLGIIPLGTGNLLALELNIPIDVIKALDLVFMKNNKQISVDGMLVNKNRVFLLNVSSGASSELMNLTEQNEKRVIGKLGYIRCFLKQLSHLKNNSYTVEIDGKTQTFLASEVIASNGKFVGFKPFKWHETSSFDDGILNIHIISVRNIWDVLVFAISLSIFPLNLNRMVTNFEFTKFVKIETPHPLLVQADGDCIGDTPLTIEVIRNSCNVFVPK